MPADSVKAMSRSEGPMTCGWIEGKPVLVGRIKSPQLFSGGGVDGGEFVVAEVQDLLDAVERHQLRRGIAVAAGVGLPGGLAGVGVEGEEARLLGAAGEDDDEIAAPPVASLNSPTWVAGGFSCRRRRGSFRRL